MSASLRLLRAVSRGNESLPEPLDDLDRTRMTAQVAGKIEELLDILAIDHRNDHNTRGTPERVARMFVDELFRGRYVGPPSITEFDNALGYDDLIVTGPIELRSTCAHHMMPIFGHVIIGIVPSSNGRIIGLSKYDRIVAHFAARLQIQEELVKQIGQFVEDATQPAGLGVRISAVHMCKSHRGVRGSYRSRMVSSAFYGTMQTDPSLKQRFLQECLGMESGGNV